MSTERDVTEHARAQADAIEGVAVPAHGVLVGGARGHVLVGHWRHATPRALLEFRQAQDVPAVGVGCTVAGLSMAQVREADHLLTSSAPSAREGRLRGTEQSARTEKRV